MVGGIGLAALIAGVMAARWDTLSVADRQAIAVKGAFDPQQDMKKI